MADKEALRLHPVHGTNGHLTYCPLCENLNGQLIFLGAVNTIYTCSSCGTSIVGETLPQDPCPGCSQTLFTLDHELSPGEKIPGSLCQKCTDKLQTQEELVKKGAIYFRCLTCNQTGLITDEEVCKEWRIRNSAPEGPLGIEFEEDCPACIQGRRDPSKN